MKAIIVAQQLQILLNDNEIEHLKPLVAKLRRMQFGRRSEKVTQQIEQLELKLEELEAIRAEDAAQTESQPLRLFIFTRKITGQKTASFARIICRARCRRTCPLPITARIAAAL